MQAEAARLIGVHDFKCFQAADCTASSSIKEILEFAISAEPPFIYYRVVGTGFLKQMVRTMAGTLVELGREQPRCPGIEELIGNGDRRRAGMTAPACGLCLDWVRY